jgi:hypothetical protein
MLMNILCRRVRKCVRVCARACARAMCVNMCCIYNKKHQNDNAKNKNHIFIYTTHANPSETIFQI